MGMPLKLVERQLRRILQICPQNKACIHVNIATLQKLHVEHRACGLHVPSQKMEINIITCIWSVKYFLD